MKIKNFMITKCIETQKYISWQLPKGWTILLTNNPDNGDYIVNSIDVAQKTRYINVNLKFDISCWAKWAEKAGIDGRAINFLILHPELVTQSCNARAITNFFNSISSFEKFEDNLPMIQMLGEGSVGSEFSTLFTTFINNKLDKLIPPKEILTNKNYAYVKGSLNSCIGIGNDYRADIASLLTTRIINFGLAYSEKNAITQDIIDRIILLCTEEDIFANDLKYMIIKGLLNGNKAKFQKVLLHPEVVKIAVK